VLEKSIWNNLYIMTNKAKCRWLCNLATSVCRSDFGWGKTDFAFLYVRRWDLYLLAVWAFCREHIGNL